jgi:hypothetical protein
MSDCVGAIVIVCLPLLFLVVTFTILRVLDRNNKSLRFGGKEDQPAYDPLVIHGRTCSRQSIAGGKGLKIPADCPKTDRDFIVDLECPDGGVARVAIPIDPNSWEGRGSRVFSLCDPPVGLNLVCSGHYT